MEQLQQVGIGVPVPDRCQKSLGVGELVKGEDHLVAIEDDLLKKGLLPPKDLLRGGMDRVQFVKIDQFIHKEAVPLIRVCSSGNSHLWRLPSLPASRGLAEQG